MIEMNGVPLTTDEQLVKLSRVVNWAYDIAFAGQDKYGFPHQVIIQHETLEDGRCQRLFEDNSSFKRRCGQFRAEPSLIVTPVATGHKPFDRRYVVRFADLHAGKVPETLLLL